MWLIEAKIDAADGFVFAMMGVMALAMGTIGLLFHCMRVAAARRDAQVDALLEELEEEERESARAATNPSTAPPSQPWEREADWWK
jgi:hypothetical protein